MISHKYPCFSGSSGILWTLAKLGPVKSHGKRELFGRPRVDNILMKGRRQSMALFLSTYCNKLDRKGRISVPAPFRAALAAEQFQGIILFCSNAHECLEGFGMSSMQELSARLDHFDLFSFQQDDLATSVFGAAHQVPFDGDGRVILPEELCSFAKLDEQASFVGLGNKFQIWNPELFSARKEQARENVKKQGLTLPKGAAA